MLESPTSDNGDTQIHPLNQNFLMTNYREGNIQGEQEWNFISFNSS